MDPLCWTSHSIDESRKITVIRVVSGHSHCNVKRLRRLPSSFLERNGSGTILAVYLLKVSTRSSTLAKATTMSFIGLDEDFEVSNPSHQSSRVSPTHPSAATVPCFSRLRLIQASILLLFPRTIVVHRRSQATGVDHWCISRHSSS